MARLDGKTAIVTGAADSLGRAAARQFAEEGARVICADTDDAALKSLQEQIRQDGGAAEVFSCDITRKLSIANLMSATLDAYGQVDILVQDRPSLAPSEFMDEDAGELMEELDRVVRGALKLSQTFVKQVLKQNDATPADAAIVNFTSIAAQRTHRHLLAQSVACAALDQMTRTLATALAADNIRVNGVAVGGVMSAGTRRALKGNDGLRRDLMAVTPLNRIGEVEDAAAAAVFLASREARFITGQIVTVDGGRTLLDPLSTPIV